LASVVLVPPVVAQLLSISTLTLLPGSSPELELWFALFDPGLDCLLMVLRGEVEPLAGQCSIHREIQAVQQDLVDGVLRVPDGPGWTVREPDRDFSRLWQHIARRYRVIDDSEFRGLVRIQELAREKVLLRFVDAHHQRPHHG